MTSKSQGLMPKYEVKKLTNPSKELDCIVLEFDDPIARFAIKAFASRCAQEGYDQLARDIIFKLEKYCDSREWLDLTNGGNALSRENKKLKDEVGHLQGLLEKSSMRNLTGDLTLVKLLKSYEVLNELINFELKYEVDPVNYGNCAVDLIRKIKRERDELRLYKASVEQRAISDFNNGKSSQVNVEDLTQTIRSLSQTLSRSTDYILALTSRTQPLEQQWAYQPKN